MTDTAHAHLRIALAEVLAVSPGLSDDDLITCVHDALSQRDQAGASLADLRNDLYAERRAHNEHRRSLAVLHSLSPDVDWLTVTAAVTSVLGARDRDHRFLTEARRLRDEACGLLDKHQLAVSEALGLGTGAPWDVIRDRAATAVAAPSERADLLEEARDALEAAGQNGAHGDDWPAITPAIRHLAAEVKLLRGNSEVDRREASKRREALATTLKRGPGADWHAVHAAAADYVRRAERAEERADLHATQLETCRTRMSTALGQTTPVSWSELYDLAEKTTTTLRDYENRLSWHTTCGEHARLLDSCRAAEEAREQAEATLTAVRQAVVACKDRLATGYGYYQAITAALGESQPATEAHPRCVCGDPIQLMDDDDPASWIHSPDSDTRCLDARPVDDPRAQWDGHNAEEKYQRISALTRLLSDNADSTGEPLCLCTFDTKCAACRAENAAEMTEA